MHQSSPFQKLAILALVCGLLPVLLYCQNTSSANRQETTAEAASPSAAPADGNAAAPQAISIKLQQVATGLTSPVALESPADGTNRLFVVSQAGTIHIIKDGKVQATPFLDIKHKLDGPGMGYSEKGLLGLAFHPQFKTNGRFFVYYSASSKGRGANHKSVVAEYKVSENNSGRAATQERVVLEFDQPESNHNGGQLAFGPDGMLYIGSGDGGGAGDKHGDIGNGQNLNTLLGKILRINVDGRTPYEVPADNPFTGRSNVRPEIWAYGLRNPWRFSFDRSSGQLFCADVGQNKYEEVNIVEKGKNYGWRIMEGTHCYQPESGCNQQGLELPIFEYPHSEGISTTGGYVYRGSRHSNLQGKYIFGDWNGPLFVLSKGSGSSWQADKVTLDGKQSHNTGIRINSFGQDEQGELYLVGQENTGPHSSSGVIYRIGQ